MLPRLCRKVRRQLQGVPFKTQLQLLHIISARQQNDETSGSTEFVQSYPIDALLEILRP
jgi:hypothetical protein